MADTYLIGRAVTHMPAGTSAGGQFAPAGGGGGATPSNAKPVGQGEKGKRVSDLQARLNALGFKPPLKLDGIFGPKTLAAVKAFQKSHGLKVDGLVGPKTTAALRAKPAAAKVPAKPAAKPAPKATAAPAPAKTTPTGTGKPPAPVAKASRALAHEKVGHTGKGLWHDKSRQLPAYIQHIANDLMQKRSMPESEAIATAISLCKKWAAGGKDVKPDTRAKAAAAVAEWERLKAGARASRNTPMKGGGMSRSELFRSYPLEDAHVVRTGEGDSTGRLVEAYAAVFNEPAEIADFQGHYVEEIDRSAFNKRIADVQRSRNGFGTVKCMYNHGMTVHGTPSSRFSMPCAVTEHISAEDRGLLTRARYLDTPLGNEVLEMWRSGAITAQSFTGGIVRSSPELRRGEQYRPRNGQLPRVRRTELGLKEFGGTPFAAYQGAELVGVRMSPLGTWTAADDEAEIDEELNDEALPPDEEAAPDGPPDVHPGRDHAHRLLVMRTEQMCREAGISALKGGW